MVILVKTKRAEMKPAPASSDFDTYAGNKNKRQKNNRQSEDRNGKESPAVVINTAGDDAGNNSQQAPEDLAFDKIMWVTV